MQYSGGRTISNYHQREQKLILFKCHSHQLMLINTTNTLLKYTLSHNYLKPRDIFFHLNPKQILVFSWKDAYLLDRYTLSNSFAIYFYIYSTNICCASTICFICWDTADNKICTRYFLIFLLNYTLFWLVLKLPGC